MTTESVKKSGFMTFNFGHLLTLLGMAASVLVLYTTLSTQYVRSYDDVVSRLGALERSDAKQDNLLNRMTIAETQIASMQQSMASLMTVNNRTADNISVIREDIAGVKATLQIIARPTGN